MHQRRTRAIAAGALLLAAPLLSSCGFNYATDRVNTISAGVNDRATDVKVLGSVIISGEPDVGVFVATFAVTRGEGVEADALVGLSAGADNALEADSFSPLAIPEGGFVSLIEEGGIAVTGDVGLGAFVPVTLTFESGTVVDLEVPVVRPCYQYADKVELPGEETVTGGSELETEIAEAEASEEDADGTVADPYSCAEPESQAH